MARAEVAWEDQPGAWHGALARMEDTSHTGACIRVSVPISVGARLKVKWHREEFSGIAKYCRRDGGDYVLGIQRETAESDAGTTVLLHHEKSSLSVPSSTITQDAPPQQEKHGQEIPKADPGPGPVAIATLAAASEGIAEKVSKVQDAPARHGKSTQDLSKANPQPEPAPIVPAPTAAPVVAEVVPKVLIASDEASEGTLALDPSHPHSQEPDTHRQNELHAPEPSQGQERTIVLNKLLHLGSGRQQHNAADGNSGNTKGQVNNSDAKPSRENQTSTKAKSASLPPNQGSLLALQDIYMAVGIMSSRLGYNIDTLSAMLDSDHMQGMSGEVKRASVLMALEAAGIPIDELLRDGAKRMDALNAYEAAEHKRFEEYEARKAQESAQIQLEIERMTAHCLERIKHNLGEVTQAKDAFLNWQTIKQKEAQRISDAVALFTKSPAVEKPNDSKSMLQTVGADSKL